MVTVAGKTYQPRKCLVCGKTFSGPKQTSYQCGARNAGELHEVESQTYYSGKEAAGLTIHWKSDISKAQNDQIQVIQHGKSARFIQGIFTTTDPEEQDFLDNYPGLITHREWEKHFISEKARAEKMERENNSLIESNQKQNTALAAAKKALLEKGVKKEELDAILAGDN